MLTESAEGVYTVGNSLVMQVDCPGMVIVVNCLMSIAIK